MSKHTATGAKPERDWVADVAEVWQQLARGGKKPGGTELAEALAARWQITTGGGERTAGGLSNVGQLCAR
jgi:hypothetical protein